MAFTESRPNTIIRLSGGGMITELGNSPLFYHILTGTIVGGLLVVLAVLLARKRGSSRLKAGAQKVSRIDSGGGHAGQLSTTGEDEVTSRTNSLNGMLSTLHKSQNDLKEKTQQLGMSILEAQRENQARSELLYSVSHELRTPLTAIIGFTELLQKKYFGALNEKQEEYVQDILESSNLLLNLINDILDLAKIESGKAKLELSETPVKELLDRSYLLVKESVLKGGLEIERKIPDDVLNLKIIADKRRFIQIMVNLLSNAIKFTPPGGKIIEEAQVKQDELWVSVADTGIGISPEAQGKIFEAFYQEKTIPGSRSSTGTGLGLLLAKSMVTQHHGRIWFESEGTGRGSRFSFAIPLKTKIQENQSDDIGLDQKLDIMF